jgi:hypothetical protein
MSPFEQCPFLLLGTQKKNTGMGWNPILISSKSNIAITITEQATLNVCRLNLFFFFAHNGDELFFCRVARFKPHPSVLAEV